MELYKIHYLEELYSINYFGDKTVTYYGTLEDAMDYADSFASHLILTYMGSIVISHDGFPVATKRFVQKDGCAYPEDWEY